MTNNIYKIVFSFFIIGLFSCNGFLDVNENPNTATEAPIDGLLASTTLSTGINHFRVSNGFSSFFVQYLAGPTIAGTTDTYLEADYSGTWGNLYGTMTDVYDMILIGTEADAFHHIGVGKIITAMNLGMVVDSWGDAPYSDAFRGDVVTPAYDQAADLYQTIQRLLDEALIDLSNADNAVEIDGDSDFIHAGDINAWIKTANSLKARYLNHLSETGSYNPSAVLSALTNGYSSNADDAQITRFEVRNPWASVAINNDALLLGGWLSEQFVDALNGTSYSTFDPRLPMLTDTNTLGEYKGTVNGAGRTGDGTDILESYVESDKAMSSPNSPLIMVSFAEIKFIEAEAALAANQGQRAYDAFIAGIKANMTKVGVSDGDADAYIASAHAGVDASNLTKAAIFREKYVALFLQPETWIDARRYDYQYPDFDLPENAALTEFIRRVQYPTTELNRNAVNAPIISNLASKLFWDN